MADTPEQVPSLTDLQQALIRADRAGDADGARKLAAALKASQNQQNLDLDRLTYGPTVGQSDVSPNLLAAGVGRGTARLWSGAKQAVGLESQADLAEQKKLDAPLMSTTAGRVGSVIGSAAPAAATLLVPGANTVAGAALVGGAMGAAEPVEEGDVLTGKLKNAAIGAATAGTVQAAVPAAAGLVRGRIDSLANKETQNAVKDQTLKLARESGYNSLPPATTNPTIVNRLAEGFAGKLSTAQQASIAHQEVTNGLVRKSLGLPEGAPLTKDTLKQIRKDAGDSYNEIKSIGTVGTDQRFTTDLAGIAQKFQGASKDFPELAKNDIQGIVDSVNKGQFDASSGIDAIAILRDKAGDAYAKGDKTTGAAYRSASKALEDLIDRNLAARGPQYADMLKNYRDARQMIARTYSVENALNDSTGNVNAAKLGQQLKSGKPLSGELKTVGTVANAYPKATKEVTESMPGVSPLDYATAGLASATTGNPAAMASVLTRPGMRGLLLSGPYQRTMGTPNYEPSKLTKLLAPLLDDRKTQMLLRNFAPAASLTAIE